MQFAWLIPSLVFGVYLAISTGTWHMLVMSASTVLVWLIIRLFAKSRQVDLEEPVTIIGGEAWIGDYQLPKYEIFWKKAWHKVVYAAYQELNTVPTFELQVSLETDAGHGLVIGPTGSGKSELLKLVIKQILFEKPDCELTLIDFKGGATFNQFSGLMQLKQLATDIDGHNPDEFWQGVRAEIGRREITLATNRASRIEELDATSSRLPRHFIFIDELATALAESAHAISALTAVAARGRTLGLHLFAATQSVQSVPRAMLTNLRFRVALADADPIDLALLNMKRPTEPQMTPQGWASGIVQRPGALSSYFNFPIGAKF
jgi:S-DNA-T family DNA segregation ATPase FtsK/SpoIIIE